MRQAATKAAQKTWKKQKAKLKQKKKDAKKEKKNLKVLYDKQICQRMKEICMVRKIQCKVAHFNMDTHLKFCNSEDGSWNIIEKLVPECSKCKGKEKKKFKKAKSSGPFFPPTIGANPGTIGGNPQPPPPPPKLKKPTWFTMPNTTTYSQFAGKCAMAGGQMCSDADYEAVQPPLPKDNADLFAPISDGANRWKQIGDAGKWCPGTCNRRLPLAACRPPQRCMAAMRGSTALCDAMQRSGALHARLDAAHINWQVTASTCSWGRKRLSGMCRPRSRLWLRSCNGRSCHSCARDLRRSKLHSG